MTVLWSDEFNGPAGWAPDPKSWAPDLGRWGAGDGELQTYTAANAALDGKSCLAVTARRQGDEYTSARYTTKGLRSFRPPVQITAKIRVPNGEGILPAFWLMGDTPTKWPGCGEIDVMESPQRASSPASKLWLPTTVHSTANDGTGHIPLGFTWHYRQQLSAHFHVYGITWLPDRITFTFNGQVVNTVAQADFEAAGGDWSPFTGTKWPFYIILNIAVGGSYAHAPADTSPFPQTMLIDWVRASSL